MAEPTKPLAPVTSMRSLPPLSDPAMTHRPVLVRSSHNDCHTATLGPQPRPSQQPQHRAPRHRDGEAAGEAPPDPHRLGEIVQPEKAEPEADKRGLGVR